MRFSIHNILLISLIRSEISLLLLYSDNHKCLYINIDILVGAGVEEVSY